MSKISKKNFDMPDESANPAEKVKADTITAGGLKIQRVTVEPGWRWSLHNKPILKTENCEKHHVLYVVSGKLGSQMASGGKAETFGPGDVADIPPGHDGWAIGDEPLVWLELPH
jgi:quercetin dioxygenase-like cupin family protein